MRPARTLRLLAALVLLAPLGAAAAPACAPGPHCPMAAAMATAAPCHGTAIQADDCCLTDTASAAVEVAPVISVEALARDDVAPLRVEPAASDPAAAAPAASPRPLYRLFRALLI